MKLNGYVGSIIEASDYLYNNGVTEYEILTPTKQTASNKFAVKELKRILALAGVKIKVTKDSNYVADRKYISIGNTCLFKSLNLTLTQKEFKFDGFIIKSVGDSYVICGVSETGTTYGVYGFLEYIAGYVYYHSTEEKIEKIAKNLKFDIKDIPTFFGRCPHSYQTVFDADYAFRLRANGEFTHPKKRHGEGTPWSTLHDQSYLFQILPFKKYYKKHPDWFYVKKDHDKKEPFNRWTQLCYSKGLYDIEKGGMFETFVNNLINNYIIPEKDKMFFMLGMNDNMEFCDCETCKKEAEKFKNSGLAMRFVNRVADAVEKWRKENAPERVIYLIGFAYFSIFDAPVVETNGEYYPIDESVIGRDNVIIQYAPISAKYLYPLMDETYNASSRKSILGWSKVAKHLAVWDYRQDFGTQTFFYPTTITAQENNNLYQEYGFIDVFNQGQPFTLGSPFIEADNFSRSRIHWNYKEDYRELFIEFINAYYKDSAPAVIEYLEEFEKYYFVLKERGWPISIGNSASIRPGYYKLEEIRNFQKILDKALKYAENIKDKNTKNTVIKRVNTLTLFYKYVLLFMFYKDITSSEVYSLIKELKVINKTSGLKYFYRRLSSNKFLNDFKKFYEGKLKE